MIFIAAGFIVGIVIALTLNKLLANKIENKTHRICLKAVLYIVCIILCTGFTIIGSLSKMLDAFITGRLEYIELQLVEALPNSDIMETNINTSKLTSAIDELEQVVDTINTSSDNYFETLVYDSFLKSLTGYIFAVESGIDTLTIPDNENSPVTIRTVLYNLKDTTLKTIGRYFVFGQMGVFVLLIICIAAYAAIVVFLKKGGAAYNKSIVFGNSNYSGRREEFQDDE